MILKKWENIPDNIKNEKTKKYYDILNTKKITLFLKRICDIIFSAILLIVLSPILIILGIAIKIDSKGPIFYRQERITQYGRQFKIFKFRTMIFNADKIGALVTTKNDSRITRVGNIIRKCRLDEIPQLINILVGDMTFVGTRPEVKKYVDRYNDEMKATLLMPAGVTSIASIKYKNEDEIIGKYIEQGEDIDDIYVNRVLPEKMKYNVDYVKKFTIFQDILICVQTVNEVLKIQNTKESTNKKQNSKEKINK